MLAQSSDGPQTHFSQAPGAARAAAPWLGWPPLRGGAQARGGAGGRASSAATGFEFAPPIARDDALAEGAAYAPAEGACSGRFCGVCQGEGELWDSAGAVFGAVESPSFAGRGGRRARFCSRDEGAG